MSLSEDEPGKGKILTTSERFYWSRHSGDGEVPLLISDRIGGGGGVGERKRLDRIVNRKYV